MKVVPISAPVLDTIITEWKANNLKTYSINTGGDAKYHTNIESLDGYKKLPLHKTDLGIEKHLNYIFYDQYEKDVRSAISEYVDGSWRSRSTCTALWYKGPDGFLGWHNNTKTPRCADACFLTYVEEEGDSFFRYIDDNTGELITYYDKPGWYMRAWSWDYDEPMWHCVYSNTNRISIGIQCSYKKGFLES